MLYTAVVTVTEEGPKFEFQEIPNDYHVLESLVEGDFARRSLVEEGELVAIVNKHGKEKELPVSYIMLPDGTMEIFGSYLILSVDKESGLLQSLSQHDIDWLAENADMNPVDNK